MNKITRAEAIAAVGIEAVERVERVNCEPTNRVGYNGACQGNALTEWSAAVTVRDDTLIAYYYTTNDDDAAMAAADGDGSVIDWDIAGYEIV